VRQPDNLMRQLTHSIHFLCVKAKILGVNDSLTPLNANAEWNDLDGEVVRAPSVNCFKGRYDRQCAVNRFSMDWRPVTTRRTGKNEEWC